MSRRQHVAVRTSATSRILLIITAIMGLLAFCWPLFLNPGALPTMRRAPRFFSPRSCRGVGGGGLATQFGRDRRQGPRHDWCPHRMWGSATHHQRQWQGSPSSSSS
ncbi:substrate-specific component CbrT of predicted cobalamin ECF transporter [Cutibacterium acnes JCM 18916]|nr:substrate-specific component CbrT of predicted cobalamin ECF transporter [Cutibacterium acnes JCM 18916]